MGINAEYMGTLHLQCSRSFSTSRTTPVPTARPVTPTSRPPTSSSSPLARTRLPVTPTSPSPPPTPSPSTSRFYILQSSLLHNTGNSNQKDMEKVHTLMQMVLSIMMECGNMVNECYE